MITRTLNKILRRAPAPPVTATRAIEAAGGGRRWETTRPIGATGTAVSAAVATVRGRARAAYANNPHARAAVDAWVTALVGTGARATATHADTEIRTAIGAAVEDWAEVATVEGRVDFYGWQAEMARTMVVDGEALALMIDTADGLRLRQIPVEYLDGGLNGTLQGGGYIAAGVEFDGLGQRVAYHIRPNLSPWEVQPVAQRIPAADVIHLFAPIGAGQVRGLSWLAPVLLTVGDLDGLRDALLTGFRVAALHGAFLKNENDLAGDLPYDGQQIGSILQEGLEPGAIRVLPNGFDVKFSSPQYAQQAPDFLSSELRAIAVGVGVPAHLVSGDLSEANYGSLRADLVAFRQRAEQKQHGVLVPQMLRPVYVRAVTSLALAGKLDLPDFWTAPRDHTRADWLFPAPPWIDPAKDAAALKDLIDAGLMSRRQAVAERGYSIEALDQEIAADRARERALGLSFGVAPAVSPPAEKETTGDA